MTGGNFAPPVGIDLGTTYSCIGYWDANQEKVTTIEVSDASALLPSCVAFTGSGRKFGHAAKDYSVRENELVYDSKRMLGHTYDELAIAREGEDKSDISRWPFTVARNPGNTAQPVIQVHDKGKAVNYSPEDISSMILRKLAKAAERHFNQEVKYVVVTIPAYFSGPQRQATMDAAKMANLTVLRLVKEPVAAAMAYRIQAPTGSSGLTLAFDLGGGTFDLSLIRFKDTMLDVALYGGDMHLGGQDFDYNIQQWFLEQIRLDDVSLPDKDSTVYKVLLRRLRGEAERAKIALSEDDDYCLELEGGILPGVDIYRTTLEREYFEDINSALFERCTKALDDLFSKSVEEGDKTITYSKGQVKTVLMVGGSTRIPKIRQLVKDYFSPDTEIKTDIPTTELVMWGAAIQAERLGPGGSRSSKKLERVGVIRDKTPKSLGIDVVGDLTEVVIPLGTTIPAYGLKMFTTTADYQTTVEFKVYEGEARETAKNTAIGDFKLEGIQIERKGVPQLEVTMEVDQNSILTVSAKDKVTGQKQPFRTKLNAILDDDDVEEHAEREDRYEQQDVAEKKRRDELDRVSSAIKKLERTGAHKEVTADAKVWLRENPKAEIEEVTRKLRSLQTYL